MDKEIGKVVKALGNHHVSARTDKLLDYLNLLVQMNGLHQKHIVPIVKLALLSELNEKQTKLALECLNVRTQVPSEAVVIAISQLNNNRHSKQLQIQIVQWILNIFDDIDDIGPIHCLYNILFYYLGDDDLSFYVVQILSKITLKNDVKRYRIEKLLQLCHKSGAPSHLSILVDTFRSLHPVEVVNMCQTHRSTSRKRKKETSKVNEPSSGNSNTSKNQQMPMPFYGFDLHKPRLRIDNDVGFPCPPLKLLKNPQPLFHLCIENESDIPLRLDMWLRFFLTNSLTTDLDCKFFSVILTDLLNFQQYIQEGLPATTIFLKRFLKTSKFKDFLFPALDLVTNIPICPMNELYANFIEPLVMFCFTAESDEETVLIINCLTQMLGNFAFVEMNKRKSTHRTIFQSTNQETQNESLKTLIKFISYMNEFILEIITESTSFTILYAVLSFYELMPDLHLKYNLPIIELPPKQIIEICLLGNNAFPITQLCTLMMRYKFAFRSLKKVCERRTEPATEILNRSLDHIKTFNCHLLLICDILFRNRAFMSENVSFYLTFQTLDQLPIAYKHEKFSLHNHPAFIGYTFHFLTAIDGDSELDDDVHSFLSKPKTKDKNWKFLRNCNLHGIVDFYNEFVSRKVTKI